MEEKKKGNGFAIAAICLSVVSVAGAFIPAVCYFSWILAILGIVFASIGLGKAKKLNEGKGLSIAA